MPSSASSVHRAQLIRKDAPFTDDMSKFTQPQIPRLSADYCHDTVGVGRPTSSAADSW